MTDIKIKDDFDPEKIVISGQCFRTKSLSDARCMFITGSNILYIRKLSDCDFEISCDKKTWENVWAPYFDMDRNYSDIAKKAKGRHPFASRAIEAGCGLRILRQDPWEMLISFIISQRKNIPAISKSVEAICDKFGENISGTDIKSFPTPKALLKATASDLKECSLGYRVPYVQDAVLAVNSGAVDLNKISSMEDEALLHTLMSIKGVGIKVANCIALFAYGRMNCVPVDVWIKRVIDDKCGGQSPFPLFEGYAGIIQQYIFYYERLLHV